MKGSLYQSFIAGLLLAVTATNGATLAHWDFNDVALGAADGVQVPGSSDGTVWVEAAADKSGNGNDLAVWNETDAGFTWHTNSAFGDFSLLASGYDSSAFTWSSNSMPGGIDIETAVLSNFTIEAVATVKKNDYDWLSTVVGRDASNLSTDFADWNAFNLGILDDNSPFATMIDVNSNWVYAIGNDALADGNDVWYHLAAVKDGDELSLYVNGMQVASTTFPGLGAMAIGNTNGVDWHAGGWSVGRGLISGMHEFHWLGHIDEVSISDAALTPDAFVCTPPFYVNVSPTGISSDSTTLTAEIISNPGSMLTGSIVLSLDGTPVQSNIPSGSTNIISHVAAGLSIGVHTGKVTAAATPISIDQSWTFEVMRSGVISYNFDNNGTVGGENAYSYPGPYAIAGIVGVTDAGYWRNDWPSYDYYDLQDSLGNWTSMYISPAYYNTAAIQGFHLGMDSDGTWNKEMLNGYLNSGGVNSSSVALSDIPYATYDIYAYFSSQVAGRTGTITDGISTYYFITIGPASVTGADALFVQATDTTTAGYSVAANYAVFTNLTGVTKTISCNIPAWGGIAAIQVVENTAGPPAAPTGLAATAGDGVVYLYWADSAASDLAGYTVYRSTTSGSNYVSIASNLTVSYYTDSSVINDTTYYYVVTASDGDSNESSYSAEVSATPFVPTPPAAPTGLAATALNGTMIRLHWNDTAYADTYNVKRAAGMGGPYDVIASNLTSTSFLDCDLSTETTYYYVVSAANAVGEGDDSTEESATTPALGTFLDWAEKPTMGWNSWDFYGTSINEERTRAQTDYMADNLLSHGWDVMTVDIEWFRTDPTGFWYDWDGNTSFNMDGYGRLIPAENRFPSASGGMGFKPLADYVHSKGLRFGIHIMRGIARQAYDANTPVLGTSYTAREIANTSSTCSWNPDMYGVDMTKPGAQEYYDSLFALYASWGVDFVKVDDISRPYDDVQKTEIEAIREAIDKTGRPMVLSLSPGATPLSRGEHVMQHANQWRISDDFWDYWGALYDQFQRLHDWTPYRGPGHFPDADMLPLGKVEGGDPYSSGRWTYFTADEQYTLMSLWSIARSPLIHGGDMTQMDSFTLSLMTNDEMIVVNQQSTHNRQLFRDSDLIAWVADAVGSSNKYLAVFNATGSSSSVPVDLTDLGYNDSCTILSLLDQTDLGSYSGTFSPVINAHGAALYRLSGDVIPIPWLSAISATTNEITISWEVIDTASSYNVKRALFEDGPYTTIATAITNASFTDYSIANEVEYYYVVSAIIGGMESPDSNFRSGTAYVTTQAVSWNLNAYGDSPTGASPTAGVVAAPYWNDALLDGLSNPANDLRDRTGATTTMDISWSSFNTNYIQGSHPGTDADGSYNKEILNGYLDSGAALTPPNSQVTLSQIPYQSYDVYVYFSSDLAGCTGTVTDGTSIYYFNTVGPASIASGKAVFGQATGTTTAGYLVAANYAVFSGLSGTDQTITCDIPDHGGIAAIQVVRNAPPAPPTGLVATPGNGVVALDWYDNAEPDLAGYIVYRSTTSGGGYTTIASGLATSDYTDNSVVNGTTYYYVVTATDDYSNESTYSVEDIATPVVPMLVAHYVFEGDATDSSGNGNDALVAGSPAYTAGRIGQAIILDGVNDVVNLPADIAKSADITIATWVYWNGVANGSWQRIFDFGNNTTQYLFLTPSSYANTFRFAITTNSYGNAEQIMETSQLAAGQWVHLAVTLAGDTGTLYLNGAAAASGTITINPDVFNPAVNYIGDSQYPADPLFKGMIDDFRIYNYALTAPEISALANPPETPTGLSAVSGDEQVSLSWNASSNAASYVVKYSLANGGPYTVANNPTTTNYVHNGLINGTTYYYVVSASRDGGESPDSDQVSAVPSADVVPEEYHIAGNDVIGGTNMSLTISNSVLGHMYGISATDTLTPPVWSNIAVEAGSSSNLLFGIPIDPESTNRFFKLDVQRQ